jgi:hypothetical protein
MPKVGDSKREARGSISKVAEAIGKTRRSIPKVGDSNREAGGPIGSTGTPQRVPTSAICPLALMSA